MEEKKEIEFVTIDGKPARIIKYIQTFNNDYELQNQIANEVEHITKMQNDATETLNKINAEINHAEVAQKYFDKKGSKIQFRKRLAFDTELKEKARKNIVKISAIENGDKI